MLWNIVLGLFLNVQIQSQDLIRVRKVIDTLSSPYFFGRGYVNQGDLKTANFLSQQYKEIGLKNIETDYFQPFKININVIGGDVYKTGGLVEKGDFIINPDAPSLKLSNRKTIFLDSITYPRNAKKLNKFNGNRHILHCSSHLVKKHPELKQYSPRIETLKTYKLTHSLAQSQGNKAVFYELEQNAKKYKRYTTKIDAKIEHNYLTNNVVGKVEGEYPDSVIIISAHYDHLGGLGNKCYFPGANDNATGIAMLLELARYYSNPPVKPKYSLLFIAFGAEEVGLLGSKFYVEHPLVELSKTKFVINLDLLGSGKEGITVVNGQIYEREFEILNSINQTQNLFSSIKKRGKAANSDHYFFSENGVKSFFIYTMGEITAYHDVFDVSKNVTLSKFKETFKILTLFIAKLEE